MKRQVLIALMLLVLPSALFAQGGGRGRGGFGQPQNVARLLLQEEHKATLGLSDDQVLKVTVLAARIDTLNAPIAAERQKLMESMGGGGGGRAQMSEEMRAKMMELREKQTQITTDATAELKTILNADQATKAEEIIRANAPGRGRRGGGGGGRS